MPLLNPPAYRTPTDVRVSLLQRLVPWNTRLPFYFWVLRSLLKGRRGALRGEFSDKLFAECAEDILRAVERVGGTVQVSGIEHIADTPGAAVFAGNHMSMLEIFLLPAAISPWKTAGFVVKESLAHNWLMAPVIAAQEAIRVGRTNPREDLTTVLGQGSERLARGRSVVVFPQGTRDEVFSAGAFNSLGLKLARRAGLPLIPFAVKTDFLANGKWLKDLGPVRPDRDVRIAFAPPIFDLSNQRAAHETCVRFIRERLAEWGVACTE